MGRHTVTNPLPTIDVTEAARRLEAEDPVRAPILVDVREPSEFATLRVPGAVLVPLSDFQNGHAKLPSDRPLLLMCAAGKRSLVATEFLARSGYRDVTNVEGGVTEWQRRGLPIRTGALDPGEGDLAPG